jgi:hypothetical protein
MHTSRYRVDHGGEDPGCPVVALLCPSALFEARVIRPDASVGAQLDQAFAGEATVAPPRPDHCSYASYGWLPGMPVRILHPRGARLL